MLKPAALLALAACALAHASALEPNPAAHRPAADYVPDVAALATPTSSALRELVDRFASDQRELERCFTVPGSSIRTEKLTSFLQTWQDRVAGLDFAKLDAEGRIDATLLRFHLQHEQQLLARQTARTQEMAPLLPFANDLAALQESRRLLLPVDPKAAAASLARMKEALGKARASVEAGLHSAAKEDNKGAKENPQLIQVTKVVAVRAENRVRALKQSLDDWFKAYDGYDPIFTWWTSEPYKQIAGALDDYAKFLREKVAGIDPKATDEPIIGDPIGREGLREDLENEMIAYTPDELLAIAEREFAWVEGELKRAAQDMGFGDDWKTALEKVKDDHVEPGQQPTLIRDLALEATRYLQDHDLVTIPPLAADVWHIRMASPERQKTAPYFLGGADVTVAFPTDSMTQEEKLQSLRSNNRHFARATVFHELLPGHHLQYYWRERSNQHRDLFDTPFWVEGWAVWWELHLWDLKYISTPEDRIGALFWRAHRCARIIFSLRFHLGEWTPQQCVDFLVEHVGHERASASAEVRRSFGGGYSPLYQAGYLLGALQLRSLYNELVTSGKLSERTFHDEILRGGPMPIEMVRAHLTQEKLPVDFKPAWRFMD